MFVFFFLIQNVNIGVVTPMVVLPMFTTMHILHERTQKSDLATELLTVITGCDVAPYSFLIDNLGYYF